MKNFEKVVETIASSIHTETITAVQGRDINSALEEIMDFCMEVEEPLTSIWLRYLDRTPEFQASVALAMEACKRALGSKSHPLMEVAIEVFNMGLDHIHRSFCQIEKCNDIIANSKVQEQIDEALKARGFFYELLEPVMGVDWSEEKFDHYHDNAHKVMTLLATYKMRTEKVNMSVN